MSNVLGGTSTHSVHCVLGIYTADSLEKGGFQ
jgi:hypothetical protein